MRFLKIVFSSLILVIGFVVAILQIQTQSNILVALFAGWIGIASAVNLFFSWLEIDNSTREISIAFVLILIYSLVVWVIFSDLPEPPPPPTPSPPYTFNPSTLTPTATNGPTAIPTILTFMPTTDNCSDAPPARLHSQLFGIVVKSLSVYTQPGSDSEIKQQLTPYQSFLVLNDPVCVDNARWFRIDYGEVQGWIVEGRKTNNSSEYFVEAVNVNASATGGCQSNFFFGSGQGCPTMTDGIPHCDEYNTTNNAAYQVFEQGIMIWLCPPDQAYVLFNDGTMRVYDGSAWWWQDLPLPPNNPGVPQRGFGGIWYNDVANNVQNRLGKTIDREWGYNATVQYVEAASNPAQDKVLLYFSIPDFNQPDSACKVIAFGINNSGRFWRYMPTTTSVNRCQRVFS